ncbi:adenylate/guanylate cyclase domain-containing protein [Nocardioides sp. R1-1]|uniref:adenylate/guanylate cyclase domain-containing protein n=1 Tax=Nocardioides sp. R1-1 TaxID=3383502 RepID=UPI0038D0A19F
MSDSGPGPAPAEDGQLTAAEVAEQAGLPLDYTRRLFRTLGFAEHGDAPAYSGADVAAMRILAQSPGEEPVDLDVALNVTRGIGITMARLADWEVGELVQHVADGVPEGEQVEDPGAQVRARLGAGFEELLVYAWRRHLAAAIERMEAVRALDDDPHMTDLSVGFADIVGFTALSNEVSRERIGELVEVFEARCGDVIAREQGRLIKSMGDAVLFVNDDPMAAFTTAEGIINVIGRDPRMPDVRVGLATGGVVLRMGDVFGPPVNLAARLTQVARRNRIIVDHETAGLLPADQVDARPLPARPVRGFGVVEPVAVRRA